MLAVCCYHADTSLITMPSAISLALELDRRLENRIAGINARLRTLDEQMRIADEILAELDGAPRHQQEEVDDSDDEYEYQNIDSSDDESGYESDDSQSTVAYYTMDENRYFSDEDEDFMSETETIVGDWNDPYLTPEQRVYNFIIPAGLEDGLEALG